MFENISSVKGWEKQFRMVSSKRLNIDTIHCCDALKGLKKLSDNSIDCVITSPPYWAMRDYRTDGQIGLEKSFQDYLLRLLIIFDEIKRILKPKGTCWVNFGDTYGGQSMNTAYAVKRKGKNSILPDNLEYLPKQAHTRGRWDKCLMGIPERFMLEMIERGWILRNKIIWHKPNHMPASVKDRLANSWEYLFLFTKCKRYNFDLDAIRIPHQSIIRNTHTKEEQRDSPHIDRRRLPPKSIAKGAFHPKGKNPADHWSIPPEARSKDKLFALDRPYGSDWFGSVPGGGAGISKYIDPRWYNPDGKNPGDNWSIAINSAQGRKWSKGHFAIFPEKLIERPVLAGCPAGGIVLDPFIGSGTTAVVAKRHGRHFIGFDLNPDYVEMAKRRIATS